MSVIIPMREVNIVEKVENKTSNVLTNAILISTKNKVGNSSIIIIINNYHSSENRAVTNLYLTRYNIYV